MKIVILAGGAGSRLYPLTYSINKHLLPVGRLPMILHTYEFIDKLDIKVDSILIATRPDSVNGFSMLLSRYPRWASKTYFSAQRESAGIPDAISCVKNYVNDEQFLVLLGDNLIDARNAITVRDACEDADNAHVWAKYTPNPTQFGVPVFEGDQLKKIEEKPSQPQSSYAIVGLYLFNNCFWDILPTLSKSSRNELEITDILNSYISLNKLRLHQYAGDWTDLGHSIDSYLRDSTNLVGY